MGSPESLTTQLRAAVLGVVVSVPAITALAYTMGIAYTETLYRSLGVTTSNVLGFSVNDIVIRCYFALNRTIMETQWWLVVPILFLLVRSRTFEDRRLQTFLLAAGTIVAVVVPLSDLEFVAIRLLSLTAVGFSISKLFSDRQVKQYATLGLVAVAWWSMVTAGTLSGAQAFCEADTDPSLSRRFELTTTERLISSSDAIRIRFDDERQVIGGLRLFAITPSGAIVFPEDARPSEGLWILPLETTDSLRFLPGEDRAFEVRGSCANLLA